MFSCHLCIPVVYNVGFRMLPAQRPAFFFSHKTGLSRDESAIYLKQVSFWMPTICCGAFGIYQGSLAMCTLSMGARKGETMERRKACSKRCRENRGGAWDKEWKNELSFFSALHSSSTFSLTVFLHCGSPTNSGPQEHARRHSNVGILYCFLIQFSSLCCVSRSCPQIRI